MKRIAIGLALVVMLAGCDKDKKAELLAKTASHDAAPKASALAKTSPPASATPASAKPPEPKKPVVCDKGPEITIDDPDLEANVRLKLSKPKGELTVSDLSRVHSVNLTRKKKPLEELDPCIFPKFTALRHLYLGPGKYRDLSPIEDLIHLESLRASINEVEDLRPLAKLTSLDRLDLGRTHVRDITPLSKLVNLTELQLDDTQVSDLSPLAKCEKLEKLSIKHTRVTSVAPLRGLEHLKFLYVEGCAINDLDTIAPLVAHGLRVMTD